MVSELIKENRSYRRFDANKKISRDELVSMIEAARYCASAANRQLLRFVPIADSETCDKIFENIRLAGYLRDWGGPEISERPVAYIAIMTESEPNVNVGIDMGIASEAITLVARERGIGACLIGSFSKQAVSEILGRSPYEPRLLIMLGYPAETVSVVDAVNSEIKYFRNERDEHLVPKLSLDELII